MWQARYETTTDVPAEALFRTISDIIERTLHK
jgi:hypothetical protein